jgi:hypothetical protein
VPRRARLLWLLAAPAALALALALQCRRPADPSGWDEARLVREMAGLGYELHAEPADRLVGPAGAPRLLPAGLYFARPAALGGRDWQEVASTPFARGWRGLVVAKPRGPYGPTGTPDQLAAGPWLLMGDPAELDRIAGRLGLRR